MAGAVEPARHARALHFTCPRPCAERTPSPARPRRQGEAPRPAPCCHAPAARLHHQPGARRSLPRLIPVRTLALYAAQRDAPETARRFDARAAQHGIRWHENLAAASRRPTSARWAWTALNAAAVAAAARTGGPSSLVLPSQWFTYDT